ncbi:DUF475 domain-containing protein [Rathayibacter sp. VKM Ac-2760]|uniref:DUF475 domain-containing protein n=1 Tax=Rathayibacter sp. VKM Ac-2760 TaxID=2609253 RepID=UPI001318BB4E|nr:DUF475 domain-containing protein [Rathayibacter sp. VKM Ac-2760]QHC57204.1 DUF475 domain-containing protein [Rathayibacter sp. VKM Ac-2760]
MLKTFGWSYAVTLAGIALGFLYGGVEGLVLVLILCVLEVSLSFDNAVVNAGILDRMTAFWQRIFLTIGVLIAVFGMRLVFPFVVVAATAGLGPIEAISLAMEQGDPEEPGSYGYILHEAHPAIAAFGGMFLLMLFLNFLFDPRERLWIRWIERPLQSIGRVQNIHVVVALAVLVSVAEFLAPEPAVVLISGAIGTGTYLLVNALGNLFEGQVEGMPEAGTTSGTVKVAGRAAFFLFLYLEVLDASFSFDGVIGAFAITSDPILIAIGLGVGAMYIRSLTIHFVHRGTLREFVFLEHGALWAVGALAVIMLLTVSLEIPELVTGLIGVLFISAGWLSSIVSNRRSAAAESEAPGVREVV